MLGISDGIDQMGTVKWDLALCLLLAWIVVYACICKGIRSSGKVSESLVSRLSNRPALRTKGGYSWRLVPLLSIDCLSVI